MGAAVVAERAEVPAVGPAEPVVRVEGLNYYYGEGEARNQVLFDNRIEIPAGDLVVMTGPSGAGKTTLLTLIGGLRTVQEGRIEVVGRDISRLGVGELVELRREIGFIFQMHNLFEVLSAYENIKMAAQLSDAPAAEIRQRSTGILERLGLDHRMDDKPRHLSAGERQRVAIARALVNRPRLILADEPTAALDRDSTMNLVELLKETTVNDGTTVLMVTHDQRIIDAADRLVHMVDGRIMSNRMPRDTTIWPPPGRAIANRERHCHQSCFASKGREERDRSQELWARAQRLRAMLEQLTAECDADIARARDLIEGAQALRGEPLLSGVDQTARINWRRTDHLRPTNRPCATPYFDGLGLPRLYVP
jgi:putative ABC transport system ATP-binding protein